MREERNRTFKTLDNASRILFWEVDEFFIMVIPIFIAIGIGSFFPVFGALLKVPYTRMKRNFSNRSLQHYVYWNFPTQYLRHLKNIPPSHKRELIL